MNKNVRFVAFLLSAASENKGFYIAQPVPDHEIHMTCWSILEMECKTLFFIDSIAWQNLTLEQLVASLRTILLQRAKAQFKNDDHILAYYFTNVIDTVGHVWRKIEAA